MFDSVVEVDLVESWWDYLQDIVTLVLAVVNVALIFIIYKWQHKDSSVTEERQRRVNQFNNIFLIPRMDSLKETFDELNNITSEFEKNKDDEDKKAEIAEKIDCKIIFFDDSFVSFIAGIDSNLHEKIHSIVEEMRDGLSHDIYDTDTSKIVGGVYVQILQTRINVGYKSLLTALFSYDGNLKDKKEKKSNLAGSLLYVLLGIIVILLGTLVYRNYSMPVQDKVTIQLDSTQMKTIIDAVQNDTSVVNGIKVINEQ